MSDKDTPPGSGTTTRDSFPGSLSNNTKVEGGEADRMDPPEQRSSGTLSHISDEAGGHGQKIGDDKEDFEPLERSRTSVREVWKFHMRPANDDQPQDWWFASTAIPLVAATLGPLANVMSIAALATSWRNNYDPQNPGIDEDSVGYPDPSWCVDLNIASLVCGFVGNIFLLFNFTRRIRYIVALPMTIILWYFATGILIGTTASMNKYTPPMRPDQTYSQGFWHAVIASVLYLCASMLLMVNMLGYFLGHYTQHFELSDDQRNLILQTMMFFIWLAGWAGLFSTVCGWSYADALYFCDVTVLTVGFGDLVAPNDVGRGLVFPFSVGGIIILGLVISSIRTFARELGHDKVVKNHVESRRVRTLSRAVTNSFEAHEKAAEIKSLRRGQQPLISAPFDPQKRTIAFDPDIERAETMRSPTKSFKSTKTPPWSPMSWISTASSRTNSMSRDQMSPVSRTFHTLRHVGSRKLKILILREEKDRFEAMRSIQYSTRRFKRYLALTMSFIAFGLLWCVGAVVFWCAETAVQDLSYFEALYFCYVSLLTVGYGDLAPRSNAGKPFFIVWSLVAVPTMTILVSDMGDTVVASYKRGTFRLGDWTVLPKQGFFREFLENHTRLMGWLQRRIDQRAEKKRISGGFPLGPDVEGFNEPAPTMEQLAQEDALDEHDLARQLTIAIRRTADDLKHGSRRHYTYEEWVEYTRLIRFTKYDSDEVGQALDAEEDEEGLIDWDWIGKNSPMMSDGTEAEWVLDRLCESLDRYMKRQVPEHVKVRRKSQAQSRRSSLQRRRTSSLQEADERSDNIRPGPVAGIGTRSRSGGSRKPLPSRLSSNRGMSSMKAMMMQGDR